MIMKWYLFVILLLCALPVEASRIVFSADTTSVGDSDYIVVDVFADTQGNSINAIEGSISIPKMMNVDSIRLGDSSINLWIEEPHRREEGQMEYVVFSGITPGGFVGQRIKIISLVLLAQNEGSDIISMQDFNVLINDGLGTKDVVEIQPLSLEVSGESKGIRPDYKEDNTSPSFFDIQLGRNESIFENKWFAVFNATDKGEGVERYEMKECYTRTFSFFKKWRRVESPVVLNDQSLSSFIWVKAIDRSGNERIVMKTPGNPLLKYADYGIWIIIILIVGAVIYRGRKWIKQKR